MQENISKDGHPTSLLQVAVKASKSALYFVGIFSFFVNIFMLTVPIYMLQLFDRVLAGHNYDTLIFLTIIACIALLTFSLLDIVRSHILIRMSHWLGEYLSPAALARCPDEILQGRPYGPQALRDISNVRQFIAGPSIFTLFDSPWVPIYLFIIYLLHPLLGLLATIGAIILFSLALLNEYATRQPLVEANTLAVEMQAHTDAALHNAEVIQAMGMMPTITKNWFGKNQTILNLQDIASQRASIILSSSKMIRLMLQIFMLGTGAYLAIQNVITPGIMIVGSILMARALAPVEQAIGAWKHMINTQQAYHRLQEHFATPENRETGIQLPTPQGEIAFENVYYVPKGTDRPIVNNFSCKIAPGSIVALIGPSGAGKTTLARLLVGAWQPTRGTVRLDGADVYHWDREDFGKHIGYLPQDVELFSGTIKENIARLGEVDDAAIINAAKLSGVHDMILHFPNGYDTPIGPGEFTLSGGQRQRIALARALYNDPQVIILDEPNASLDNEGEIALQRALISLKKRGATCLLIAHRPVTVQAADQIIVMSQGGIQMAGPKDDIMKELKKIAEHSQENAPTPQKSSNQG